MNTEALSARLLFRSPTIDDLDFMLALIRNGDVVRYIPGITTEREHRNIERLCQRGKNVLVHMPEHGQTYLAHGR